MDFVDCIRAVEFLDIFILTLLRICKLALVVKISQKALANNIIILPSDAIKHILSKSLCPLTVPFKIEAQAFRYF